MKGKREKLVVITPSGKEYEIGFLSPCKDGFVLGASQVKGVDTSHLTILSKKGTISSHITPQHQGDRKYFAPLTKKEIVRKYQLIMENEMFFPLPQELFSQNVVYVTRRLFNLLDSLRKAIYHKKITRKERIHILNFMKAVEEAPKLYKKIMKSPESFMGMCKAEDLLKDKSKFMGMTDSRIVIFRYGRKLYGIPYSNLTGFDFIPSTTSQEAKSPLTEIFESFGISQYMQQLETKKFLDRLFKNESEYSSAPNMH